jgi:hypothetical protein
MANDIVVIDDRNIVVVKDDGEPEIIEIIDRGILGATIISAEFEDDDIVFNLNDDSHVHLVDAKITLKGEQGVQGIQGIQGVQGLKGDKGDPGVGDMIAATYDPQNKEADAFNADNHTDGLLNAVLTKSAQNISGLKTFLNALYSIGVSKFGEAVDNFSEFESDGTLKFNGNATVWNDIILQVSNLRPGNTPPSFSVFTGGIYGLRFDAGSADEVHGAFEIPHDYKEGSNMVVHCHWSPTTTNTGNIVFGFEYSWGTDNAVFSAAATPTSTPAAAPGVVNKLTRTNIVALVGTNFKIGDIIAFRFFRQNGGTDTFTGNAFVHSIGIHYEADTVGSRQITSK